MSTLSHGRRFAAVLAALVVASSALAAGERHLSLVKSDPANSAKLVKAPSGITLWFTQKPNLKLTKLILTSVAKDTIKTGAAESVDSTGRQIRVSVDGVLGNGKYDVMWRTVSRDGHAVSGKFAFSVDTAQRPTNISSLPR